MAKGRFRATVVCGVVGSVRTCVYEPRTDLLLVHNSGISFRSPGMKTPELKFDAGLMAFCERPTATGPCPCWCITFAQRP
jgi:hypothetical protein